MEPKQNLKTEISQMILHKAKSTICNIWQQANYLSQPAGLALFSILLIPDLQAKSI
ncbi:hypothetical protein Hanom_Chr17g01586091 [Helianthus anomalus]